MTHSIKTGIIYVRVSDHKQIKGTSLKSQVRICRQYAARAGITVVRVFIEEGRSAKTANRPQLREAITFCRKRRISSFIVYKVDRFARYLYDHETIKKVLAQTGTELHSSTEALENSPSGRAKEGMLAVFAQYDNEVRTERVLEGMQSRTKQGVWMWMAPHGYMRPHQGANIQPDPKVAPYIKLAFELYRTGFYSYERLARHLGERGFRSPHGQPPRAQLLQQILANPIYCGIIEVWGEQFQGRFPAIVSRELFEACQQRANAPTQPTARSFTNPLFPLRGFVECSHCATALTGSSPRSRNGNRYPYYHHYNRSCKVARHISPAELEGQFARQLSALKMGSEIVNELREAIMHYHEQGQRETKTNTAAVRKELSLLEEERQRIFELHRRGVYADNDFREQKQLIEDRIKQKSLLINNDEADFNIRDALDPYFEHMRDPARMWLSLANNYPAQIEYQKLLLPQRMQHDGKQLRTTDTALIYKLSEAFSSGKSCMVDLMSNHWNQMLVDLKVFLRSFPSGETPP